MYFYVSQPVNSLYYIEIGIAVGNLVKNVDI